MTHWSNRAGWGFLIASYLVQAGMILWGPPPVKAAGVWFAAQPGMDPLVYGIGAAVAAGWGHGDDPPSVKEKAMETYRLTSMTFCDEEQPFWWCPPHSFD